MEKTLFETILHYDRPEAPALYYENRTISYRRLWENVRKMVTYFRNLGIRPGDVVTVSLPNIPSSIYAFYALNALGAIQNIVHPLTPLPGIVDTMKQTRSRVAICLATEFAKNRELIQDSGYTFIFANPMQESLWMRHAFYLKYTRPKGKNVFLLDAFRKCAVTEHFAAHDTAQPSIYLHSGGTTGKPKVIALSDDALNHLAAKADGIITEDLTGKSMLAVLPTFHGFGLGMGIHTPLYFGASVSLMMKFNADKIIRWINEGKVHYIIGVPLLYQKLMQHPDFLKSELKNLRLCFVGGENVHPSMIEEFNATMRQHGSECLMMEGYGLTETVTVCNVNTRENFRIGSVGKGLRDITVQIRDEDGALLDAETTGEVYIAGDTLMNGYLNDPEATAETMVTIDGTTYIRTGDIGYLDEDGFLYIKDRKKRMFKINGMNVYPSEIEKIVTESEHVHNASMEFFETPKPHTILFVIPDKNTKKTEAEIASEIQERIQNRVLKYSYPKKIVFVKEFPKTSVGKVDHKAFKDPD